MTDIVERLRSADAENTRPEWIEKEMGIAADEIEALRQRVKELEEDAETVAEKLSKECAASLRLMEELAALRRKVELYEAITTGYEHERVEAVLQAGGFIASPVE